MSISVPLLNIALGSNSYKFAIIFYGRYIQTYFIFWQQKYFHFEFISNLLLFGLRFLWPLKGRLNCFLFHVFKTIVSLKRVFLGGKILINVFELIWS